jgi:cephalosporin hydroxylase
MCVQKENPMMTEQEAAAWHPEIPGWSDDIIPYYQGLTEQLPRNAVMVEVGVAHGRSLVYMAERLVVLGREDVELWGVDFWPGHEVRKIQATLARFGRPNVTDMIRLVRCDGVRAARLFDDHSIDVVFEDSDHTKEGVSRTINAWLPKVKRGGILAGHDYSRADWPGVVEAVDDILGCSVAHPTRSVWQYRVPA